MTKCVTCKRFLSPKGAATCATCRGAYHRGCVGLPIADSVVIPRDWVCPECEGRQQQTEYSGSGTPSKGPGETQAPLASPSSASPAPVSGTDNEVNSLRRVLDAYMTEQREFREEIRATLKNLTGRMDEIERRLDAVEKREAETTVPQGCVVDELQQTVARLQMELSDRDQEALLSDLDIGHVPEAKGENVVHTVTVLAAKLGVVLDPRDVVFAERVGAAERGAAGAVDGGAAGRPRRIVVRLARRQLRDEMLRAARVRRNFTSADAGLPGPPCRVYVNERLTRSNRLLFHQVREVCRKQQWRFAWTKRGRVFARQGDGKQAFCIRSECDFTRVFGPINV